ncbi:MAG: hypothetical protein JO043_03280 [Candidatus Eremiobacteraeota bacterium]|nr:hypothetical protein [Candidatus Eremiobacteraeota bacterium]
MAPAFVGAFAIAASLLAPARALPPPAAPGTATPSPSPAPSTGAYLPVGSPIDLVLDEPVDSHKTAAGTVVHMHLKDALRVGGVEVAQAGLRGTLRVVMTRPALSGDQDGAVELQVDPLPLPGRGTLPLYLTRSFVTVEMTAGQQSTRDLLDSAEDVLIPGHVIYHALRKGHELTLARGTTLRARTGASIDASRAPTVVIATPAPVQLNTDVPHSDFTPIPLYTLPTPPPRQPAPRASAAPPTSAPTPR